MVEDDGEPHIMNLRLTCLGLRQGERKEPARSGKQWKILVSNKRSGGKLLVGLGIRGRAATVKDRDVVR